MPDDSDYLLPDSPLVFPFARYVHPKPNKPGGLTDFYRKQFLKARRTPKLPAATRPGPSLVERMRKQTRRVSRGFLPGADADILIGGERAEWEKKATHLPPKTGTRGIGLPRVPGSDTIGTVAAGVGGLLQWHIDTELDRSLRAVRAILRPRVGRRGALATRSLPSPATGAGRRGGDRGVPESAPLPKPKPGTSTRVPTGDPVVRPEPERETAPSGKPPMRRAPPGQPQRDKESLPADLPPLEEPIYWPVPPPYPGGEPEPLPDIFRTPKELPRGLPSPQPSTNPHPQPQPNPRPGQRPGPSTRPLEIPSIPLPFSVPFPGAPAFPVSPRMRPGLRTPVSPRPLTPFNEPGVGFEPLTFSQPMPRPKTDKCVCTDTKPKPRKKSCRNPVISRTRAGDILTTKVRLTCPQSKPK